MEKELSKRNKSGNYHKYDNHEDFQRTLSLEKELAQKKDRLRSVEVELSSKQELLNGSERKYRTLIEDWLSNDSNLRCAICQEIISQSKTLSCGHIFCGFCIDKWEDENKKTCPMCRMVISKSMVQSNIQLDSHIEWFITKFMDTRYKQDRKDNYKLRIRETEIPKILSHVGPSNPDIEVLTFQKL